MVSGPPRLTKTEKSLVTTQSKGASPALVAVMFLLLMAVLFAGGDGGLGGWIMFVKGSSGAGASRNGFYGGGFWPSATVPSNVGLAIAVTAMAGIAVAATLVYSRRGSLKPLWSRGRRNSPLQPQEWDRFFTPEGRLVDGGVQLLKKVRSGGVDPSIRAEVWPFLLGVYDLNSSQEERDARLQQLQKEYESLRKQCQQIQKRIENSSAPKQTDVHSSNPESSEVSQVLDPGDVEDASPTRSLSVEDSCQSSSDSVVQNGERQKSAVTSASSDSDLTDSLSSDETETLPLLAPEESEDNHESLSPSKPKTHTDEDFTTWQRIIRLDAVRANGEWILYSPSQANVSETKAQELAIQVNLKDYEHLEVCRIFHAARLVAILEAYAMYDPEIGYCQGMSDLLSPIVAVVDDDVLAFWCFAGFMKKARHNFRLDEVGIRRQLSLVSKIIEFKDIHLYRHLQKLQAEDCFFVYRMVVVMFRRELTLEQTLWLWEVMWADQAALRVAAAAGKAEEMLGVIRRREAPPTEDLLLYAIAASVLQRRKTIIEQYMGVDEIMRACNSMAGHLDVWKLLEDAHHLVAKFHDKIRVTQ